MKKSAILIILLIFIIPISFGVSDYNETGNYNSYYEQGLGFIGDYADFDEGLDASTRILTGALYSPYVSDLDGDGIKEIMVLDDDTLRLYHGTNLEIIDAYTISNNEYYSNPLFYDIDDDGYTEFIIGLEQTGHIEIAEYNGSIFKTQSILNFTGTPFGGEMMIKCKGVNNCVAFYMDTYLGGGGVNKYVRGAFFDSENNLTSQSILTSTVTSPTVCFPFIEHIAVGDYDIDGNDEYIFTVAYADATGDLSFHILWVGESGGSLTLEQSKYEQDSSYSISLSPASCIGVEANELKTAYSSPYVANIDGSLSNGLETVVAFAKDTNEYIMRSYKSNSDRYQRHPDLFDADGILVSNIVRYDDTTFCVMGYDSPDEQLDLLCSDFTGDGFLTQGDFEFFYDISGTYNVTDSDVIYTSLIQTADWSTEYDGHEIISSYGVFGIGTPSVFTGDLYLLFNNPIDESSLISVDAENNGRDDLIALTDSNIWYLDDGYTNSGGRIQEYYINPCVESTWEINTSTEIRLKLYDVDNDMLSGRVIVYYNDDNEQDSGWSINVSSGTTVSFSDFNINKTISVGTIRMMAKDTENPDTIDIIDVAFSVSTQGVVFGECITYSGDIIAGEEVESEAISSGNVTEEYTLQDNNLKSAFIEGANISGIPVLIFVLIMMLGIDIILIMAMHRMIVIGLITVIGFDIMFLVIVALMGLIVEAIIISLFAILIIIGGFWASHIWNKTSTG